MKKYLVDLTDEERTALQTLVRRGKTSARKVTRARILLHATRGATDSEIASALGVGVATVERIRRRFVEAGLAFFGFGFVGNEVVEAIESFEVDRLRGGGVDDAADFIFAGELDGVVNRFEWDFELHDHAVDGFEQVGGGIDVGGFEEIVRALDYEDAVLAVGLDEDGSYAAGRAFDRSRCARGSAHHIRQLAHQSEE